MNVANVNIWRIDIQMKELTSCMSTVVSPAMFPIVDRQFSFDILFGYLVVV